MKLTVCGVRDSAMDAFMRPFFVPTTAVAVRLFRDDVNKPDSQMHGHESDYELFELGVFDDETGKFGNLDSPRSLVRGSDIKEVR